MTGKLKSPLLATVAILLVAVGVIRALETRQAPQHPDPETLLASAEWTQAVQSSDSVSLGTMAVRQCRVTGKECYLTLLLSLAESDRIPLAMGALSAIADRDRRIMATGHDYAHAIGMRGYDSTREFGEQFVRCTVAFQSGCYHGLIQVHLTSGPEVNKEAVEGFCDRIPGLGTNQWLRFQCAHGLGHGLLMAFNHDLPKGLAGCDFLEGGWDREVCYGGAFMENVIATDTHHMPVRAASATASDSSDDHGDHGDHAAPEPEPAAPAFPRINPADPYYPCSILHEHYLNSCYAMQTSIMLEITDRDWSATARLCDGAPVLYRTTCYQSMGTNISGSTVRDATKSIALCSLGTEALQPWCYLGVVKNFVDVTSNPDDGLAFCREVPGEANRLKCHEAVGEELMVLYHDVNQRIPVCDRAAPEGRDACRYGARIVLVPPPGLPFAPVVEG